MRLDTVIERGEKRIRDNHQQLTKLVSVPDGRNELEMGVKDLHDCYNEGFFVQDLVSERTTMRCLQAYSQIPVPAANPISGLSFREILLDSVPGVDSNKGCRDNDSNVTAESSGRFGYASSEISPRSEDLRVSQEARDSTGGRKSQRGPGGSSSSNLTPCLLTAAADVKLFALKDQLDPRTFRRWGAAFVQE